MTLALNAAFGLLAVALLLLAVVLLLHAQAVMLVVVFTQGLGRFALAIVVWAVFFGLYIASLLVCRRARRTRCVSTATLVWALVPAVPAALLTFELVRYGIMLLGPAE
jgi:hypothetical protein